MPHMENKIKVEQTLPLRESVVRRITDALENRLETLQESGLRFTPAELSHACMLVVFEAGALIAQDMKGGKS